jgi:hypothetical protein
MLLRVGRARLLPLPFAFYPAWQQEVAKNDYEAKSRNRAEYGQTGPDSPERVLWPKQPRHQGGQPHPLPRSGSVQLEVRGATASLRRVSGGARARLGRAGRGEGGRPAMGHRVVSAQQCPRIPLIARQLRSRRFPGPGLRALVASESNPPASAKHRGIGAAAPLSEVDRSSSFSWEGLRRGLQRHSPS